MATPFKRLWVEYESSGGTVSLFPVTIEEAEAIIAKLKEEPCETKTPTN